MATGSNQQAELHEVTPRTDCPHIRDHVSPNWANSTVDVSKPCTVCNDASENWRCLECQGVYCSRYVNGHAADHNRDTSHPIVVSFSDLSTWCYACDDYVTSPLLHNITLALHVSKFGSVPPNSGGIEVASEEDSTGGGEGTSNSAGGPSS